MINLKYLRILLFINCKAIEFFANSARFMRLEILCSTKKIITLILINIFYNSLVHFIARQKNAISLNFMYSMLMIQIWDAIFCQNRSVNGIPGAFLT